MATMPTVVATNTGPTLSYVERLQENAPCTQKLGVFAVANCRWNMKHFTERDNHDSGILTNCRLCISENEVKPHWNSSRIFELWTAEPDTSYLLFRSCEQHTGHQHNVGIPIDKGSRAPPHIC